MLRTTAELCAGTLRGRVLLYARFGMFNEKKIAVLRVLAKGGPMTLPEIAARRRDVA